MRAYEERNSGSRRAAPSDARGAVPSSRPSAVSRSIPRSSSSPAPLTRAERAKRLSAASGSPYGMSEAHRICSGGTSESRLSWSSGVQVELSKKMFSTLRASLPMPACATIAACARISDAPGCRSATCPSSSGMPGGSPRPAWMSTGRRRSCASAKTASSCGSLTRNACARGCSLMPRAPRSRQRSASPSGSSSRLSRTNGKSRSGASAAHLSTRSFGRAVGRLAVGLVEREDVRAAVTPASSMSARCCSTRQRVAILIESEMRVRVERLAALGEQRGDVSGLRREQLLGTLDQGGLGHRPEPIRSPHGRSHATWSRFSQHGADPRPPSCGEAVVRLLEQYGTDTVFGIPGRPHARDLPRPRRLGHPPRLPAPRAGRRRSWPTATRASRGKPGVCVLITGAGLDQRCDADRRRLPRLDPDARDRLRAPRPRATTAGGHGSLHDLPDQRAFMAHHHGRLDRGPRPGRAARRVRPGVRDLRVPAAAARAHRHSDRRARPARRRLGAAAGARRAAGRRSPRSCERAVELLAGAADARCVLLGGGAVGAGAEATAVAERLGRAGRHDASTPRASCPTATR